MHILHYSPDENSGFMYQWPQYHMIAELRTAGHDVRYLNPVEKLGRIGSADEYSEILLDKVKEMLVFDGCDMLFTSALDNYFAVNAIREIRRLGVPTVLMHCDDLSVPFLIRKIASSFDLVWATARENINLLKSYGARVIMMPYAANPYVYKPIKAEEEREIGFIGRCYGARVLHISTIARAGLPVHLYGKSTQTVYENSRLNNPLFRAIKNFREASIHVYHSLFFNTGRCIVLGALKRSALEAFCKPPEKRKLLHKVKRYPGPSFDEIGSCYSRMAMSLGSIEYGSTYVLKKPVMCIHLREFEAPMCGAVHLVNRFAELQEYFEEDKEMLFYGSEEELLDKVRYYLKPARDGLRNEIRKNARRRAENDHTWTKRFEEIWDVLGVSIH